MTTYVDPVATVLDRARACRAIAKDAEALADTHPVAALVARLARVCEAECRTLLDIDPDADAEGGAA